MSRTGRTRTFPIFWNGLPDSVQDSYRSESNHYFLFPHKLIAKGDNWNGIMKDTLREECEEGDDCLRNCCVSPYFAPLFFVVFVLMAQFVLVNVVVAVLMKHLEESHKQVN